MLAQDLARAEDREPQTIVDDVRKAAIKLAQPFVRKHGYQLRETDWDGVIRPQKTVWLQLQAFKGNDYVVWISADLKMLGKQGLKISLLNENNELVPSQSTVSGGVSILEFKPESSGTYRIRLELGEPATHAVILAMLYAYK